MFILQIVLKNTNTFQVNIERLSDFCRRNVSRGQMLFFLHMEYIGNKHEFSFLHVDRVWPFSYELLLDTQSRIQTLTSFSPHFYLRYKKGATLIVAPDATELILV